MGDPTKWTPSDVAKWLRENGFEEYVNLLTKKHKIDGLALLTLTEKDLKEPPITIHVMGDIKRIIFAIKALIKDNKMLLKAIGFEYPAPMPIVYPSISSVTNNKHRSYDSVDRFESTDSYASDDASIFEESGKQSHQLDPEIWKTVLSFLYCFGVVLMTAFVMVIVHDRVPDMNKYPPLPDIFLDNIPVIPWAFEACETIGLIMMFTWTTILVFHKHRFILMRRMFSLTGTVFLLRCFTMLITSLSVPGSHLKCHEGREPSRTLKQQFDKALVILSGFGMTIQGVRTCGDYMFSGHTVCLTLLNFFITEASPRRFYFIHTLSWVLNIFGIFFILAAHEHYSIDVFIAFYITSRLFLYYHTLANNRSLMQRDTKRTRIWFPLFSFFESKVDGIVPNEYEFPFTLSRMKDIFSSQAYHKKRN